MFLMDLAFAVGLIAFGVGIAFLIWSYRSEGAGVALAKVAGYVITLLAVLGILCTTYYGTKYWREGYFHSPIASQMMLKKRMMKNYYEMMKKHPMMMQQMREQMQKMKPMQPQHQMMPPSQESN